MLRWGVRLVVSLAIVAALLAVVARMILGGRDPLDSFEVVAVEGPSMAGKYAVTFRHYHSNSSNTVFDTWLQSDRPSIASREPPSNTAQLGLVTMTPPVVISRRWQSDKLTIVVADEAEVKPDTNCNYEYEKPKLVCFEPKFVDVVRAK